MIIDGAERKSRHDDRFAEILCSFLQRTDELRPEGRDDPLVELTHP